MAVKKILLDTNAYAAFKKGDPDIQEVLEYAETVGVNSVVLGELLSGFANGSREQKNRNELFAFLSTPRIQIYPLDMQTAKYYSQVYIDLKKKGSPIPTNDMWIAATTLEHGLTLCTLDKHFRNIDNLLTCKTVAEFYL